RAQPLLADEYYRLVRGKAVAVREDDLFAGIEGAEGADAAC
ncbi:hypothetical protein H340_23313, partial [Streptomyces mobaraensis NBRC 13819 = DSM 40847]